MTIKQMVECDNCHRLVDYDEAMFTGLHAVRPRSLSKWIQRQAPGKTTHFCDGDCERAKLLATPTLDREKV